MIPRRALCRTFFVTVGLFASLAGADDEIVLGQRYVDSLHGFSLCPPVDVERIRETASSRLVRWQKRDPQRNAVLWTLSVLRAVESGRDIDLKPYSEALADKLRREENFRVESIDLAPVAGKAAIHLEGMTGGAARFWQRQVWVLTRLPRPAATTPATQPGETAARGEGGEFLVIVMSGPADIKARLASILQKVLETVKIVDPQAARAEREERLKRGGELLASLMDKDLAAAVQTAPLWYLLRMKGRDVGFMRMVTIAADREGAAGYEVRNWVMLDLPKTDRRLLKREMFTTVDRSVERWREQLVVGEGPKAERVAEDGIKQREMIVCTVAQGGQTSSKTKAVPVGIYLPRAMGSLLGGLVDLKAPGAYGFAIYTSGANSFDLRSFTVVGPDRIEVAGRRVDAVRATDQLAEDAEASTLWLDEKGVLLRMVSADGLEMEPASQQAVTRRFADALEIVRSMGE